MYYKKITLKLLIANYILFFSCIMFWISVGMGMKQLGSLGISVYVIMGFILLCSIFIMMGLYLLNRYNGHGIEENMKNLEHLNTVLRTQRHDYLNQMQIVYGLLELDEYEEAKKYMKPVFDDITKVSRVLKTAKPAVNALLQAKSEAADRKGIEINMHVVSDIKNIKIEQWELSKVLANLIDNAINAVEKSDEKIKKRVSIEICESPSDYIFRISNNGPAIPKNQQELIFKKGFSTKREEGHGLGLMIVTDILRENSGKIDLRSDESDTVFTVSIGK